MMVYPLAIGGSCIITSIIGTWFVRLGKSKNIMGALYKGFIATAILSLLILYPLTNATLGLNENYSYSDINFTGFDLLHMCCYWIDNHRLIFGLQNIILVLTLDLSKV